MVKLESWIFNPEVSRFTARYLVRDEISTENYLLKIGKAAGYTRQMQEYDKKFQLKRGRKVDFVERCIF